MLKKFMGQKYFCGLDIGSQSIKAAIVGGVDNNISLAGVYETRTNGYQKASITDLEELSECIQVTISGLTKKTGIKVKDVVLGVGGGLVQTRQSHAVIPLSDRGNKVITNQDITKVQTQARLLGSHMEEIVLHNFPQYYKVDDVNIASNPLGLYGRKLEMSSLLILAQNNLLKNLTMAVNQAGYDVAHLFFASFACAQASLSPEQKGKGCVLVDIGSSLSNILMFKDDQLKSVYQINLGGDHITQAIVQHIKITFDLAEELKKSYASAVGSEIQKDEEILIRRDENYVPVRKEIIQEAIEPVINDFARAIVEGITHSPLHDQMNTGIVMMGGGSLLQGLPEHVEQITNLPVQIGKINLSLKKLHNAAKFASAVGLAQGGPSDYFDVRLQSPKKGNPFSLVTNKIKEMYQEYF